MDDNYLLPVGKLGDWQFGYCRETLPSIACDIGSQELRYPTRKIQFPRNPVTAVARKVELHT